MSLGDSQFLASVIIRPKYICSISDIGHSFFMNITIYITNIEIDACTDIYEYT